MDTTSFRARQWMHGAMLGLIALLPGMADATAPQLSIRIHNQSANTPPFNKRDIYINELIQLILSKSCPDSCTLEQVTFPSTSSARNALHLQKGRIDIAWINTNRGRESVLRPIRYPIYKGLIGWRLLLVKQTASARLAQLSSLQQLQQFWGGQGHDWPDTRVLRNAGLRIRTADPWESIISLLEQDRIDYFPRGLNEIAYEEKLLENSGSDIIVEQHLALHYPAAVYLYVAKHNGELAKLLEDGFEAAISDGSFNALFTRYFADDICRARLANRRILDISNDSLSEQTPLTRAELWFDPERQAPCPAPAQPPTR